MKIAIITTNDIGNGNIIEIAILIPKDTPIHNSWLIRNCLLLNPILSSSFPPSYISVRFSK